MPDSLARVYEPTRKIDIRSEVCMSVDGMRTYAEVCVFVSRNQTYLRMALLGLPSSPKGCQYPWVIIAVCDEIDIEENGGGGGSR